MEVNMVINMTYYYKGSNNTYLELIECSDGGIDLLTAHGEIITSIASGYGLMRVLEDLRDGKYA